MTRHRNPAYSLSVEIKAALVLVMVLCLAMAACSDDALTKTSTAIKDTALGVAALQQTVIDANKTQAISDNDTLAILNLCAKINSAGQQASAITRGLTKLTPAQRGSLTAILTPIIQTIADATTSGLIGVKDPGTRQKVLTSLSAIQASLNAVNVILAATHS